MLSLADNNKLDIGDHLILYIYRLHTF